MISTSPGDKLGPYEVAAKIGAGGMGEVWKARDPRLGRTVAIKLAKEKFSSHFEKEARAIAQINHPHVCQIYDVGPNFLVMEYVEGEPLRGPLPLQDVLKYGHQICAALQAAHDKEIVHRDLKPANILLTRTGAKVLDFGLAKRAAAPDPALDETLTLPGGDKPIAGTPPYMAPEQFEGRDATPRSDIFSLGCVLYEMITGNRAFEGKTLSSVASAVLACHPAPIRELRPEVPVLLDNVVQTCLAKDPEERWQSARDVEHGLRMAAVGSAVPVPAPPRRTALFGAIGVAAAACLFTGVLLFRKAPANNQPVRHLSILPPPGSSFSRELPTAISPNGQSIAFVAGNSLWLRSLNSTVPRLLDGTEGAQYPFWSPDGSHIGFFANYKVKRVSVERGSVTDICDAPAARGATWNRGGTIVLGRVPDGPLYQVPAGGGQAKVLTSLRRELGDTAHYFPFFLPDGDRFLFFIRNADREKNGIGWSSLSDPAKITLIRPTASRGYRTNVEGVGTFLVWTQDGALQVQALDDASLTVKGEPLTLADGLMSFRGNGLSSLGSPGAGLLPYLLPAKTALKVIPVARDGKVQEPLRIPLDAAEARMSEDGERAAMIRNSDIWIWSVRSQQSTRITDDAYTDSRPRFSPDGSEIAYSSSRGGGPFNIYVRDTAAASPERRLTNSDRMQNLEEWTPDGKWLLYSEIHPETKEDLWMVPASGGKPLPVLRTKDAERGAAMCPVSALLAYVSDETGRPEVYVREFDPAQPRETGRRWQISSTGGSQPHWRGDGKELLFLAPGRKVMSVGIQKFLPFEAGPARLATAVTGRGYQGMRDGKTFYVSEPVQTGAPELHVILNWWAPRAAVPR